MIGRISWIVATHDRSILEANLLATLELGDDQMVIVENAPSIAVAYNRGQAQAEHPVRCYVHHDVQILNTAALRTALLEAATPNVGIVGLTGSRNAMLPWWKGEPIGGVVDARLGPVVFDNGGPAAVLDGLLLATAHHVDWDETIPGWHIYDHDACMQMTRRGLPNLCIARGADMVLHNTNGPASVEHTESWETAAARYWEKWS